MQVATTGKRPTKVELFKQALKGNEMPLEAKKVILQFLAKPLTDHEKFRKVLATTDPSLRQDAYETLRPLLPFRAKPLDVYIMESAQQAEREKLAVVDPNAPGGYREFTPARNAHEAIADQENYERDEIACRNIEKRIPVAPKWGMLLFRKCTRTEQFLGETTVDCRIAAVKAGWVYEGETWVCPKCPAVRVQ